MLDQIFFAPDDGGQGGGGLGGEPAISTDGSFDDAATAAVAGDSIPVDNGQSHEELAPPAAFFEIEDEKGKKYSFANADELKQKFHEFGMLRSDYSRKTEETARERERLQSEKERIQSMLNEVMGHKSRYDKYEQFFKSNPHIFRRLQEEMKKGTTGDVAVEKARGYVDERTRQLEEKLQAIERREQERQFIEAKSKLKEQMKKRYPDFDADRIEKLMSEVDPSDMGSLMELMYHAWKGYGMTPEQQARVAEAQRQKQQSRMIPGSGVAPARGVTPADSLDAAREAAMRDLAG